MRHAVRAGIGIALLAASCAHGAAPERRAAGSDGLEEPSAARSRAAPGRPLVAAEGRPASPLPRPTLEEGMSTRAITDVFLCIAGQRHNLTAFPRPQHIYGHEVSPSGDWAFVWHMERPPRIVTVYDTRSCAEVASFSPGRGGSLCWTSVDSLLHSWGAGTCVAIFAVYDRHGRTIETGSAGALEVSPGRRFVLMPPVTLCGEPLEVMSLETFRVVYHAEPDEPCYLRDVTWHGDTRLTLRCLTDAEVERVFEISLD